MSSSPFWTLLPIPRTFGSNTQFLVQLPISRTQDLTLRKQGIWKASVSSLQSPSRTFPPDFKFSTHSLSPGFQFGVTVSTSYVAEGTIFNFPVVSESNTWRCVPAPGAIRSIDTCSKHSRDPTPRVIHTKLPHFGGEEDAADNRD